MAPTIRIDDDVYKWLQSQAVPFEDNPNSVLRRLAGLDHTVPQRRRSAKMAPAFALPAVSVESGAAGPADLQPATAETAQKERIISEHHRRRASTGRRPPLARGPDLIRQKRIPVRQARFHRDGSWYEKLDKFPAAYCDRFGYVPFDSADDLRTTPGIRIEPSGQVWVPGGISSLPGFRKFEAPIEDPDDL
jgi:hypothetical protein